MWWFSQVKFIYIACVLFSGLLLYMLSISLLVVTSVGYIIGLLMISRGTGYSQNLCDLCLSLRLL